MARALSKSKLQSPPIHQPILLVEKFLYDKRSAAHALSVSVSTIEAMIARKQLSFQRCGVKVLIPVADIRRVARRSQLLEA